MTIWDAGCEIPQISKHLYSYLFVFLKAVDRPEGPKRLVFIDDSIIVVCLTVIYMPILICHSTTGWVSLKLIY